MSIETYRDKRTAAAEKYRLECLNAKGEVECSECGMAVPEPRANRNAQELAREKVRKLDNGPICNACASSWRYSHHQDAEVELANAQADSITAEDPNLVNGKMRCSCGGTIEKVGDDEYECDDCSQRYERDDWSTGGPDNPSKLKAIQNATKKIMVECPVCHGTGKRKYPAHEGMGPEDCSRCDGTGKVADYQEVENAAFVYVGDEVKVKDDPGLWIVMDYDGGTYTLKGNNGIKKVRAEQIMRNADPATCKGCKHGMDEHNADGDCMNCGKTCGPRAMNNASADFRTSKEKRAAAAEAYRNAGSGTCDCGHSYDEHQSRGGGALPCSKCQCRTYHPKHLTEEWLKSLDKKDTIDDDIETLRRRGVRP